MQPIRRHPRDLQRRRHSRRMRGLAPVIHGSIEREYWRTHYTVRDYVQPRFTFRDYEPAYRYGWEFRAAVGGGEWPVVERELAAGWNRYKGDCPLTWNDAAPAVRDGYLHAGRPLVAA